MPELADSRDQSLVLDGRSITPAAIAQIDETTAPPPNPVDLGNCDREPIHLMGAIQPIGFLLALDTDWTVVRASANVAEFLGDLNARPIGRPLGELFRPKAVHALRNRLAALRGTHAVSKLFDTQLTNDASAASSNS